MRLFNVVLVSAFVSTLASAQSRVGDEAADFTLQALEGGEVSLSDFRGQVVLLNFFGYG